MTSDESLSKLQSGFTIPDFRNPLSCGANHNNYGYSSKCHFLKKQANRRSRLFPDQREIALGIRFAGNVGIAKISAQKYLRFSIDRTNVKDYRLTHYELELMGVIWELEEASVQDVCDALPRELAYTTVMTTLSLLAKKKKVLKRIKRGRAYIYQPAVTREEVSQSMLGQLKQVLLGDSLPTLMVNLLENENMSEDDISALKNAINKLESKE
ncbi:BlaI/MecI/CopY family transcriptional regulator [Gimesia alba]|uniref:BlaI/MecI/CopY family transcriptional regulator n=1 Tax=Gimesia alba TaxID=2527973 RepID=UPI001E2B3B0E|nr:BlaI/MecI/CopY family transcriptional regulator [Gimesia alba]